MSRTPHHRSTPRAWGKKKFKCDLSITELHYEKLQACINMLVSGSLPHQSFKSLTQAFAAMTAKYNLEHLNFLRDGNR